MPMLTKHVLAVMGKPSNSGKSKKRTCPLEFDRLRLELYRDYKSDWRIIEEFSDRLTEINLRTTHIQSKAEEKVSIYLLVYMR